MHVLYTMVTPTCLYKCACECMCVWHCPLSRERYYVPFSRLLSCSVSLCHLSYDSFSSWRAGSKGRSGKLRWGLHSCPVARLQPPVSKRQARSGCHGDLSRVKGEWHCGGSVMSRFLYTHLRAHTQTCMHMHTHSRSVFINGRDQNEDEDK